MTSAAARLVEAARAAEAEVRAHKQAQRQHRTAAREAAARLSGLKAECARLGITLSLVPGS